MAGGGTAAAAAACRVAASTLLQGAFHSQLIYTLFIETTSPDPKTQLHMLLCTGELAVAIFPEVKETINCFGGYNSPKTWLNPHILYLPTCPGHAMPE